MQMQKASEASTTSSDFRMHAAASDCVTVETCRRCGVPVPVPLNCLPPVWRIRFPCRKLPMTAGRAYGGS